MSILDNQGIMLVEAALQGDTQAFGELVDKYWGNLTALVYQKLGNSPELEDIIQETFIRAYKSLSQLNKPESFAPWLYQIASRICVDKLRSKKRNKTRSLEGLYGYIKDATNKDNSSSCSLSEEVLDAIGSLPELYRVVVTLRFLDEMSCKEIAEHLNEPQGTIRNRLFRANSKLRRKLSKVIKTYRISGEGKEHEFGRNAGADKKI